MKVQVAAPVIISLVYRAYSHDSLTPLGIGAAAVTAIVHALHPWNVFFVLLVVFFLAGTAVTKVKKELKAKITHSSSGLPGGEGARTHIQVLANSLVASLLVLAHAYSVRNEPEEGLCWSQGGRPRDVLVAGIVANYAAVAADTFSSELGILAPTQPRLITAPWKKVAPGTNGGVTISGLSSGLVGSFIMAATATYIMPFCSTGGARKGGGAGNAWQLHDQQTFMFYIALVGLGGSLLDSLLGAVLQASVVDTRTGKVIEGEGGGKVLVHSAGSLSLKKRQKVAEKTGISSGDIIVDTNEGPRSRKMAKKEQGATEDEPEHHEGRKIETGMDLLTNNQVNLVMAATMSVVAMVGAAYTWNISLADVVADALK